MTQKALELSLMKSIHFVISDDFSCFRGDRSTWFRLFKKSWYLIPILILGGIGKYSFSPSAEAAQLAQLGGPESVSQGRYQVVEGIHGMVVSDDREASAWGAEILKEGGNAIDAAVATAMMLAVTRPHYASIGGGGFLLYCPHPVQNHPVSCQSIDYREMASNAAKRDMYIQNGKANTHLSQNGALASGVPGVPAGLFLALKKFGTLSRQKLLSRPIEVAKKGFLFSTHGEYAALDRWEDMNLTAKNIFGCFSTKSSPHYSNIKKQNINNNKINKKNINRQNLIPDIPCPPGTLIRQPDLARVLKEISRHGTAGFYEGWVAKKIVQGVRDAGGLISLEDLRSYEPRMRQALHGSFEGYEVVSMAPPSSGGAVLLQLLHYTERAEHEGWLKKGFGSPDTIHALVHAMGLAFSDRAHFFGDPDYVKIPLETLLSPSYLDQRWRTFRSDRAAIPEKPGDLGFNEPQHTTHFSVMDREGNAVAITTTINDNFGSGFVPPGTGIVMNDEMDDFSVEPGVPNQFGLVGDEANSIRAHKRPLSSMTPTIVRDSQGNNKIVIGAAGGPRITTSVFLSLVNRIYFKMPLLDAVASPRFHEQWKPITVMLENFGFPSEVRSDLEKKGYTIQEVPSLGKVHALERLPDGRMVGAPDPRGEGAAVGD